MHLCEIAKNRMYLTVPAIIFLIIGAANFMIYGKSEPIPLHDQIFEIYGVLAISWTALLVGVGIGENETLINIKEENKEEITKR